MNGESYGAVVPPFIKGTRVSINYMANLACFCPLQTKTIPVNGTYESPIPTKPEGCAHALFSLIGFLYLGFLKLTFHH